MPKDSTRAQHPTLVPGLPDPPPRSRSNTSTTTTPRMTEDGASAAASAAASVQSSLSAEDRLTRLEAAIATVNAQQQLVQTQLASIVSSLDKLSQPAALPPLSASVLSAALGTTTLPPTSSTAPAPAAAAASSTAPLSDLAAIIAGGSSSDPASIAQARRVQALLAAAPESQDSSSVRQGILRATQRLAQPLQNFPPHPAAPFAGVDTSVQFNLANPPVPLFDETGTWHLLTSERKRTQWCSVVQLGGFSHAAATTCATYRDRLTAALTAAGTTVAPELEREIRLASQAFNGVAQTNANIYQLASIQASHIQCTARGEDASIVDSIAALATEPQRYASGPIGDIFALCRTEALVQQVSKAFKASSASSGSASSAGSSREKKGGGGPGRYRGRSNNNNSGNSGITNSDNISNKSGKKRSAATSGSSSSADRTSQGRSPAATGEGGGSSA